MFFLHATTAVLLGLLQVTPTRADLKGGGAANTAGEDADKLGAVSSEFAVCSKIGTKLIQGGGNAVDAIVGTTFCVGTLGMYHSGIGGGGFMLIRSPSGKYDAVDFREVAPAAATEGMFVGKPLAALYGGAAVAVPGELRGLEYAHNKYGKLAWADVVTPSVILARDGFEVTPDIVRYMDGAKNNEFLIEDSAWALDFAPTGTRVQLGDTMTRTKFAATLATIAKKGASAFYTGAIAKATINTIRGAKGVMTMKDLADYEIQSRKTASINYKGYKVTSTTAPSSGEVMLSILNIMKGYDDLDDPDNVNLTTHRMAEAMRWSYSKRSLLGDPAFVDIAGLQAEMLTETTAAAIRKKISDKSTYPAVHYDPEETEAVENHGTAHMVAADKSGFSVALTTTVNRHFGSRLMVPETGVILNNHMDDFATPGQENSFRYAPAKANFIRPGKRPLSSTAPTIIEYPKGGLFFISGSAGGSKIPTATAQIIHYAIDQKMTTLDCLDQPRFHDQLRPDRVQFENTPGHSFSEETIAYMEELGHEIDWVRGGSSAQALRRTENGTFDAAGEPRQQDSGGFAV